VLTDLLYRLRALVGRRRMEADLDEEVRFHFEHQVAKNVREGMSDQDARREARLLFGGIDEVKEQCREARGVGFVESTWQDLRYALRGLRKSPGFTAVAVLSFALGIGLNTAIFSVVNAVLLEPLPYPDSRRIVLLGESTPGAEGISVSWVNFENWLKSNHSFEGLAGYQFDQFTLTGRVEPLVVRGQLVNASFFPLLGMRPAVGRFFSPEEDRPGAGAVLVLSHRFWINQLGGDPDVVGSSLTLSGQSYPVIGIAEPLWLPWNADLFVSIGRVKGATTDRREHNSMRVLGRLKPGVALADAKADLDSILIQLAEVDPGPEDDHRAYVELLAEDVADDFRGALLLLMAAAGLVLLIASANIASMVLARNTSRTGEFAVRAAIGANRARLVRQVLTENLVLAFAGGVAGVLLAVWSFRALVLAAAPGIPRLADTELDSTVLLFACGATLAAGLLAGIAPVLVSRRADVGVALKESSRTAAGSAGQGFRNALVVAEVALTFVLALGSGLLIQSLISAQRTHPGFDADDLLAFSVRLPASSYEEAADKRAFYDRLLSDIDASPGVSDTAAVVCAPGAGICGDWFYSVPGEPIPEAEPVALFNRAMPGYFRKMGIPIIEGREFTAADTGGLGVINATLARKWWPNESAVGHQIKVGGPKREGGLLEIVGVVGDVKQYGLDSTTLPEFYTPTAGESVMTVLVRGEHGAGELPAVVRARLSAIDRDLPPIRMATFAESYDARLSGRRFTTSLLTLFAVLAMALSAVGVYGLLSYWVTCRESEIAVRLALGAQRAMIWRWSALKAFQLAAFGIAFGLAGGWVASQSLEDIVFGVSARDPRMMAAASLAVLLVAALAAAIPSWRASRIDAARRLQGA
jgi:putative ABC transport system permease protein